MLAVLWRPSHARYVAVLQLEDSDLNVRKWAAIAGHVSTCSGPCALPACIAPDTGVFYTYNFDWMDYTYLQYIEQMVLEAGKHGILVMLDLHAMAAGASSVRRTPRVLPFKCTWKLCWVLTSSAPRASSPSPQSR